MSAGPIGNVIGMYPLHLLFMNLFIAVIAPLMYLPPLSFNLDGVGPRRIRPLYTIVFELYCCLDD